MLREYFTNRWVIGGFCFLIVFGIACYFWYQQELAPYEQSEAETAEMLSQAERAQKAETAQAISDAPVESATPTIEQQSTGIDTNRAKNPEATHEQQPGTPPETAVAAVPISPFGLGPYPEVPEDYPYPVNWAGNITKEFELLERVQIKLWKQGIHAEGVIYGNGDLIYPVIRGVVYVTRDGDSITGIALSHPEDDLGVFDAIWEAGTDETFDAALDREEQGFTLDDLPAGLTAVDYDTAGIDPYEFLGLPRR